MSEILETTAGVMPIAFGLLALLGAGSYVSTRLELRQARRENVPQVILSLGPVKGMKFARRLLTTGLAGLVAFVMFGLSGSSFTFWPSNIALIWQRTTGDWILTGILIVLCMPSLVALWHLPESTWGRSFLARKKTRHREDLEDLRTLEEVSARAGLLSHRAIRYLARGRRIRTTAGLELLHQVISDPQLHASAGPWKLSRAYKKALLATKSPLMSTAFGTIRDSWETTTRHEAGHAVAQAALGGKVYLLRISHDQDRGWCGTVFGRGPVDRQYPEWLQEAWHDLVSLLAGEIAQEFNTERRVAEGSRSDWLKATVVAVALRTRGVTFDGRKPANAAEWLTIAHTEAADIVSRNDDAIERVVEHLRGVGEGKPLSISGLDLEPILGEVPLHPTRTSFTSMGGYAIEQADEQPHHATRHSKEAPSGTIRTEPPSANWT